MILEEYIKTIIGKKHTLEPKDLAVWLQEIEIQGELKCLHVYVYILEIVRDTSKNIGEWWHILMHTINSFPSLRRTLILRTEQMTGQEIFTINGRKMAFIPIDLDKDAAFQEQQAKERDQQVQPKCLPPDEPKRRNLKVVK